MSAISKSSFFRPIRSFSQTFKIFTLKKGKNLTELFNRTLPFWYSYLDPKEQPKLRSICKMTNSLLGSPTFSPKLEMQILSSIKDNIAIPASFTTAKIIEILLQCDKNLAKEYASKIKIPSKNNQKEKLQIAYALLKISIQFVLEKEMVTAWLIYEKISSLGEIIGTSHYGLGLILFGKAIQNTMDIYKTGEVYIKMALDKNHYTDEQIKIFSQVDLMDFPFIKKLIREYYDTRYLMEKITKKIEEKTLTIEKINSPSYKSYVYRQIISNMVLTEKKHLKEYFSMTDSNDKAIEIKAIEILRANEHLKLKEKMFLIGKIIDEKQKKFFFNLVQNNLEKIGYEYTLDKFLDILKLARGKTKAHIDNTEQFENLLTLISECKNETIEDKEHMLLSLLEYAPPSFWKKETPEEEVLYKTLRILPKNIENHRIFKLLVLLQFVYAFKGKEVLCQMLKNMK